MAYLPVGLRVLAVAAVAGLAAVVVALPASARIDPAPQPQQIDQLFDQLYAKYGHDLVGMCVGAVDSGLQETRCYGTARPGQTLVPGPDTLFAIGSLTKDFTATVLALRVDQGRIGLRDRVRKYVPVGDGRNKIPGTMTLLDLAQHFSGLPRTPAPRPTTTSLDDLYRDAADCISRPSCRHADPGTSFLYSNFAFAVLGQILGAKDGYVAAHGYSGWEADTDEAVLRPLDMSVTKTTSLWNASNPAYFSAHKAFGSEGSTTVPNPLIPNPPWSDPGGALYSSPHDMLTWLRFNLGLTGPADLKATLPLLYADPSVLRPRGKSTDREIGLSWNVDQGRDGTCVWKSGSVQGFQSYMVLVPREGLGDFVLLNSRGGSAPDPAAIGIDLINALPYSPVATKALPGGVAVAATSKRCPAKGATE